MAKEGNSIYCREGLASRTRNRVGVPGSGGGAATGDVDEGGGEESMFSNGGNMQNVDQILADLDRALCTTSDAGALFRAC